jgi:hypothetical protein
LPVESACICGVPASPHTVHIPVMGTGFTVDTPLNVAKYGISSVISLLDDELIEMMRKHHMQRVGEEYAPIASDAEDARAHRITAYLDFIDRQVKRQIAELKAAPFTPGSDITRYFELLPDCELRQEYEAMLACTDSAERARRQAELRGQVVPGRIDVNLMTKLDMDTFRDGVKLPQESCYGMAALRGFALSTVRAAIVFSAGLNQRMYAYCAQFPDFLPDAAGRSKKEIILKVSDYRSALIQGKFFAKHGLWVAEYRVESGLNCGGHAFAAKGQLLGPVLEEFKANRADLAASLFEVYQKAATERGVHATTPPPIRITAQGGITTAEENRDLMEHYGLDGTGWGTPFLLVPEVTNVDAAHLRLLARAREGDVWLSNTSPMGVPFWVLRTSAAERRRQRQIAAGHPGSPCFKHYAEVNTEFTEKPLCVASRAYQRLKLADLEAQGLPQEEYQAQREQIIAKSCICHDLAGGATVKLGLDYRATPAVCCGPSIVRFTRTYTLDEMLGHAYGRLDLLAGRQWPHMFATELKLSVMLLKQEVRRLSHGMPGSNMKSLQEIKTNLNAQIEYYGELGRSAMDRRFTRAWNQIRRLRAKLEQIKFSGAILQ